MTWVAIVAVVGMIAILVWMALLHRAMGHLVSIIREHKRPHIASAPPGVPFMEKNRVASKTHSKVPTLTMSRKIIHDLNNHLGTISGFADAALEDLTEDHPIYSDLREIQEAARKAKDVVKELNAMTKDRDGLLSQRTAGGEEKPSAVETERVKQESLPKKQSPPVARPVPEYRRPSRYPPTAKPEPVSRRSSSLSIPSTANGDTPMDHDTRNIPSILKADLSTGTEHLLIVDDETQLLRMFKRFFEPLGYQVTTFSDSVEARDDFREKYDDYDLAIIDQKMPDLTGASLATEMLSIRPDLPIILLSGYSDMVSPADAARIGIRRFLSKPIPQSELNETVRSVLDEQPHCSV